MDAANAACRLEESRSKSVSTVCKMWVPTSMLQDVEAGRSLEVEAVVGPSPEMADPIQSLAPTVCALVKLLNSGLSQRQTFHFVEAQETSHHGSAP